MKKRRTKMDAVILVIVFFAILITIIVEKGSKNRIRNSSYTLDTSLYKVHKQEITQLGINDIKNCGQFTPEERAAEYRRRGKSPSGVIDGEYNDEYRGNDEYNDEYRDWDANA